MNRFVLTCAAALLALGYFGCDYQPICPTGYTFSSERGVCIGDAGGPTPPSDAGGGGEDAGGGDDAGGMDAGGDTDAGSDTDDAGAGDAGGTDAGA
ncbi:MAG: hypothetical protein M3Y87_29025 [Myxococcota bacterium]|nr:hypothetical protein [Myxococcota bacterium]